MAAEEGDDVQPSATLYVRGLNERLKLSRLQELLREMFSEYGTIIDIVAKKNLKAKGQAFIVYDSVESAEEALDELQGFDLDGHPMTLAFARTRSDATVVREDGEDGLEVHRRRRIAEKERKQALAASAAEAAAAQEAAQNSHKRALEQNELASRPAKAAKGGPDANTSAIPDEYLPPNKILFLRDLVPGTTKDALAAIFSRFGGFKEVRTVPGRAGIAFVEYEGEEGAIAAKEGTTGMVVGGDEGKPMRVTFQRK